MGDVAGPAAAVFAALAAATPSLVALEDLETRLGPLLSGLVRVGRTGFVRTYVDATAEQLKASIKQVPPATALLPF